MIRTEISRLGFDRTNFIPRSDETAVTFKPTALGRLSEEVDRRTVKTPNLVLSSIPETVFERLAPWMRRMSLHKEEFLFQPDDDAEFIYFPESAAVSEFRILEDGRMVEVAIVGRDGAIGLSKLFCSSKIPNCVQVSQAGLAIRVNAAEVRRTIRQDPKIAFHFYPFIDAYIRQISQKTVCNLYHSVRARFCTWLLMVQDRCDNPVLQLTHEQIARTLGVYRPRITCIARDLKNQNIIDYSRGGISICDRSAIEAQACDCYHEIRDYAELDICDDLALTLH